MKTKEQTFEVVLFTTNEEVDGEYLISEAIKNHLKKINSKHINDICVEGIKNEWMEKK